MGTRDVLLAFIHSFLLDRNPAIPDDVSIDWDELMTFAHKEGVLAIVWDQICNLPPQQKPDRCSLINWGLSAQKVKEDYEYQKSVLLEMVRMCDDNHMKMLLLKGVGLSELYPNPSSRESGDIDFYLFGEFEKGNQLFAPTKYLESHKHASFIYKGVQVENHHVFINQICGLNKKVEQYLEFSAKDSLRQSDGYYILPPVANIVFLMMHSIHHLCSDYRLPLRNLIDMVLLIGNYVKKGADNDLVSILQKYKLNNHYELLVYLSEWSLGMNFPDFHLFQFSEEEKRKAYQSLIETQKTNNSPKKEPYFVQLKKYMQRRRRMSWLLKYEPTPFYYRLYHVAWIQLYILAKRLLGLPEGESFKLSFKKKFFRKVFLI